MYILLLTQYDNHLKTFYIFFKEGGVKLNDCRNTVKRCKVEIGSKKQRLHQVEIENSELKRRLMDAQKYKDQLKEVRSHIEKEEYQVEKLQDKLEVLVDDVATCKIDLLNAGIVSVRWRI